jgi:hypothetical protein
LKFSQIFEDAQFLAEFANLDPDKIDGFRESYPDFFPETFWPEGRAALEAGRDAVAIKAIRTIEGFDWRTYQAILRQAWVEKFSAPWTIRLVESSGMQQSLQAAMGYVYPYQSAVMYLHAERWRAKICSCGIRFVAEHAKRKFCSVKGEDGLKCSERAIRESHRKSWSKHGDMWRPKKSKNGEN